MALKSCKYFQMLARNFVIKCFITILVIPPFRTFYISCPNMIPANIHLDEDFLKTSFVFVFGRRLQDVFKVS